MAQKTLLLSWNLYEKPDTVPIVTRYVKLLLKQKKDFVIAVQESHDDANTIQKETGAHAFGNGGLILLSSHPLKDRQLHKRFVMSVISLGGKEVAVFSYHGHGRGEQNTPSEARGGYASEYRWIFEDWAKTREILVMGDFNAEPEDPEIGHHACFSFQRTSDRPEPATLKSHHGRPRKDMRIIAPPCEVGATFFHNADGGRKVRRVYDYFAASPGIVAQIQKIKTVKKLDGTDLSDVNGYPNSKISDHFPVRADWVY